MLDAHYVISRLLCEFPQFRTWRKEHSKWMGDESGLLANLALFARFSMEELYEEKNFEQLDSAFAEMERLLTHGTEEVRQLVAHGFLEGLRSLVAWKPYGSDLLIDRLRPESRRIWDVFEAASGLNLDDCGVLEREVISWRIVRQNLGPQITVHQQ